MAHIDTAFLIERAPTLTNTGHMRFEAWADAAIHENDEGRMLSVGDVVRWVKNDTLVPFGTFGAVEVYFFANRYQAGIVCHDSVTMRSFWFYEIKDAVAVIAWADELGLHPRVMANGGR